MDKEDVERMHETMQSAGPREIQRNNSTESYYEITIERILDKRLRERVAHTVGEEQLGFRKGRGTTDGMFSLRQLVEKILERQGNMALAFVDLEKTFDTVPRKMAMATLRLVGAP